MNRSWSGRLAPIVLALAGAALMPRLASSVGIERGLLPVRPTAPANGSVIEAAGDPLAIKLAWSIPSEPVAVRFFVEVVTIEQVGSREVFAGYVDRPSLEVQLAGGAAQYAWRVYAVGRDVAAYALSRWVYFSVRAAK